MTGTERTSIQGSLVRWRTGVSSALVAMAILAVYGQTLTHPFSAWDDEYNIPGNPNLNPPSWQGLVEHWSAPYGKLYVPATYTFWAAEAWLADRPATTDAPRHLAPWIFHAGNVVLHLVSSLLVLAILRIVVGSEAAALCGALLYALHPLQVESVAWITETKGLLCGALGWLAVWLHLRAWRAVPTRRAIVHHLLAAVAFALALLAKPSAVALPAIAVVLDVVFLRQTWRPVFLALAPWFLLAAAFGFVTGHQQSGEALPFTPPAWWQRPLIAGDALAFYLWKTLVPLNLAMEYSRRPSAIFTSGVAYYAWLLPVAVVVAIGWLRERRAWWGALAIFVLALLPVLGLAPFAYQVNSTVADRYVYLAMLGPALAASWFIAHHTARGWFAGFAALCAVWAGLSAWQASLWRDDRTLFQHTVDVNPNTYLIRGMLGFELLEADPPDVEGAIEQFRAAIPLSHEPARPHAALGGIYYSQHKYDEALVVYERAIELDDTLPEAHNGRGAVLNALGRRDEAIAEFRRAIEADASFTLGWFNLARALRQDGQLAPAVEAMRRGLALTDDPIALDLVWILAAHPEARFRDGAEAVRVARRYCELLGYGDARALDALAAAYAEQGDFEAALTTARRARAVAEATTQHALALAIAGREQMYAAGRPYRSAKVMP